MTRHCLPAIVSIHDVMPETLDDVQQLLDVAADQGVDHVTLLVVPGKDWQEADLNRLRLWQDMGHALAGHGWCHRCRPPRTWQHRLHSRLLSRDVAEHLSETASGCDQIVQRCAAWFDEHGFRPPRLYVPPAWALGPLRRQQLTRLGFDWYETLSGVIDTRRNRRHHWPLLGFEADTRARQVAVAACNRANWWLARLAGRPLRIAWHPRDLRLRLQRQLIQFIAQCDMCVSYAQLLDHRGAG